MGEFPPEFLDFLICEAISEAKKAAEIGEVPVGAVVSVGGSIVARAHNLIESSQNAAAHAEILAIERASKAVKNWRLTDAILAVTLEPCTMCSGAIKLSRIPTIVFGAKDPRGGAVGSLYDLLNDSRTGNAPTIFSGIREAECRELLSSFFARRRKETKAERDAAK